MNLVAFLSPPFSSQLLLNPTESHSGHSESIYTKKVANATNQAFEFSAESLLLSICQHTVAQ